MTHHAKAPLALKFSEHLREGHYKGKKRSMVRFLLVEPNIDNVVVRATNLVCIGDGLASKKC